MEAASQAQNDFETEHVGVFATPCLPFADSLTEEAGFNLPAGKILVSKAARWHARPVYKSSLPATIVEHRGNFPVGVRTDNLSGLPELPAGNAT